MNKLEVVKNILRKRLDNEPLNFGKAYAPINIAVCKYWGKRNEEINLPYNSSLSVALPGKGALTRISISEDDSDVVLVNGEPIGSGNDFVRRLNEFLDLFRGKKHRYFKVATDINIPIAAGLASSACGYAALVLALDNLFGWQLDKQKLSILARLGSGSACRSLWNGFVEWQVGKRDDGMDSFGVPLKYVWPDLRVGLYIVNPQKKKIFSRLAMQKTVAKSPLYPEWVKTAEHDFKLIRKAIRKKDFELFGEITEANALAMHGAMMHIIPPIIYSEPKTFHGREKVYMLRKRRVPIYFTQDAGPNLKLFFLESDTEMVRDFFPDIEIIAPFNDPKIEQVILVDKNDKAIGVEKKIIAHQQGLLHRAFSAFVFRRRKDGMELLLQKRQEDKYHSGGLWSNTCCSHPRPTEDLISAAKRRLQEEMGFITDLSYAGSFHYKFKFPGGMIENELDHVLVGIVSDVEISVNKHEVQDYKWVKISAVKTDFKNNPQNYTLWFKRALSQFDFFAS